MKQQVSEVQPIILMCQISDVNTMILHMYYVSQPVHFIHKFCIG